MIGTMLSRLVKMETPSSQFSSTDIPNLDLSFLNNLSDISTYYSNIQSGKIKSKIPGIFIAFDKIKDYFEFYYQNQNYKMNQQHQKNISTSEINELRN